MINLKPMLAASDLSEDTKGQLRYPLLTSPKLDGIRALVVMGPIGPIVVSRSLKPIRSAYVQRNFAKIEYLGFDGELIAGSSTDKLAFNNTTRSAMTVGSDAELVFHIFDMIPLNNADLKLTFLQRRKRIRNSVSCFHKNMELVEQWEALDWDDVKTQEEEYLAEGYEGLILRDSQAVYKFGRSTLKEQALVKLKAMQDSEAKILGFVELQHNANEAFADERGYKKHSSAKAGKVGMDTLGSMLVEDLTTGVVFSVGSGFTDAERKYIWDNQSFYIGKIITYKYFPVGVLDKPRHPIFKGFRDLDDL